MTHENRHAGRTALITGAATGIGQEYARRLAEEGADIVVVDLADASETIALVEKEGRRGLAIQCDVSDPEQTSTLAEEVGSFGTVDILINNAGIYPFSSIDELTVEQWHKVMAVNVDSVFLVTKQFLPGMRANGWGRIINMASAMFHGGFAGTPHYVASKGAVIGFTRALAPELGPDGITINALAPSLVRSAGTSTGFHDEVGMFDAIASMQSIKRTQMPDDLSGVVSFLASEDGRFISGQTLVVDGGLVRS